MCGKIAIYVIQGTDSELSQPIALSINRSFMISVSVPLSSHNNIRVYATLESNGEFSVTPTASCRWISGQIVDILK
jgi:hypothetical protein